MGIHEDCGVGADNIYKGWVKFNVITPNYRYYPEETPFIGNFILSIGMNKIFVYKSRFSSVDIGTYNVDDFFSDFPNITNNEKHMFELRFGVPLDGLLGIIKCLVL